MSQIVWALECTFALAIAILVPSSCPAASNVPGPQSPDESLKSIQLHDGFTIELVAAEPLVMDPISLDWGSDGKLWVVEMAD